MIVMANDDPSCLISLSGQVVTSGFRIPPAFWSAVTTELSISWVFSGVEMV